MHAKGIEIMKKNQMTVVGETIFHHDQSYTGDVLVVTEAGEFTVPFADLRALVLDAMAHKAIGRLEAMSTDELEEHFLGVREPRPLAASEKRPVPESPDEREAVLELVARAIARADGFDPDEPVVGSHADPGKDGCAATWEDYMPHARAALGIVASVNDPVVAPNLLATLVIETLEEEERTYERALALLDDALEERRLEAKLARLRKVLSRLQPPAT